MKKAKIITVSVIKGGTGKTATAAALLQAGAKDGKKVLGIDVDPQSNLSLALSADCCHTHKGTYHIFNGMINENNIEDAIQTTPQGIDCIVSTPNLATYRADKKTETSLILSKALMPIKDIYDVIIIDTPPTLGTMVYNALYASTNLIIPLETDTNSLQGLYQIASVADAIRKGNNKEDLVINSIITRYDGRPKINRYIKEQIAVKGDELGIPLAGVIRSGVVVREAIAMQQSLYEVGKNSKPAQDYLKLYNKIMED